MNQAKSLQKSHTSRREPRSEKLKKNSKDEKDSERKKVVLTSSAIDNFKVDKRRSESLTRPRHPFKSQESPQKSYSVDRKQSRHQASNIKTEIKTPIKSLGKNASDIAKKASSSTSSTKQKHSAQTSASKSSNPTISNSKVKSRAPKIIERKNSVQVAKSFVKNVQSKSTDKAKGDLKRSSKKEVSKNGNQDHSLERPKTSTIRKGPPESLVSEKTYEAKETKSLASSHSLSRSKASLHGESDNDRGSYEEDFEDYDSDFEESDAASISESSSDISTSSQSSSDDNEELDNKSKEEPILVQNSSSELLLNMPPESTITNKQGRNAAEKTFLRMSDRTSLYSKKTASEHLMDKKPLKLSRSFIDFSTAIEKNEDNVDDHNSSDKSFENNVEVQLSGKGQDIATHSYNNHYSRSNLKQAFVQTENCEEEEIQTDEIVKLNKWTQNPTNGTSGYGGDEIVNIKDNTTAWKSLFNVHSTKLTSFLQKSSNIILTLLDEEFTAFSNDNQAQKRPNLFYSDGYYTLFPLKFLLGAPITCISCSENSPYIVTIHGNMTELPSENGKPNEKGILCVWNILDILTANSQPTCGTFGPGGSDIVIAGMVDGAVLLWDLTDINANDLQIKLDVSLTLRAPSYNTALIFGQENHSSCVVGIQTVSNFEKDWRSTGSARIGSMKNFHVMTLEDMGVLIIWVVVEVLKPDISGLESDLGLAPGGKFRLVRSSSILLYSLPTLQVLQKTSIRTFDFRPVPFDTSRMLVSTDAGIVLHITRHSGGVEPRFYGNETDFSVEIRCIDCSPHNEDLFMVGCSDGSIKLYNIKLVHPVLEFLQPAKGESINLLKWSPLHPSEFCVLSSSSHIHLWNLMENSIHPIQSYNFEDVKITWFVFKTMDKSSTGISENKISYLIISKENGEVEVHTIQKKTHEVDYQQQIDYMDNL
ncbi:hypothetical protein JTE90_011285 [Oedothorax gibbosus]|uniref:WD repeat-containing protein 60 n=1 Tax=Oedothorax gibbosus TaxID=931172 RepID=A0AAV6VKF8_9ARAC|nr:hypothetical protein JTE90_011285 [Oedothorax gibbosus]